jgi:hypothetical protein
MPLNISFRHKTQGLCGKDQLILNPAQNSQGIRTHNWLTALILKIFGKIFDLQLVDNKGKKHVFHLRKVDLQDWIKRNQGTTVAAGQSFEASIAAICKRATENAAKNEESPTVTEEAPVITPEEETDDKSSSEPDLEKPNPAPASEALQPPKDNQSKQILNLTDSKFHLSSVQLKRSGSKDVNQIKSEAFNRFKNAAEKIKSEVHRNKEIAKAAMMRAAKKEATAIAAKAKADHEAWIKDKKELVALYRSHIKPLLPKAKDFCYQEDGSLRNLQVWEAERISQLGLDNPEKKQAKAASLRTSAKNCTTEKQRTAKLKEASDLEEAAKKQQAAADAHMEAFKKANPTYLPIATPEEMVEKVNDLTPFKTLYFTSAKTIIEAQKIKADKDTVVMHTVGNFIYGLPLFMKPSTQVKTITVNFKSQKIGKIVNIHAFENLKSYFHSVAEIFIKQEKPTNDAKLNNKIIKDLASSLLGDFFIRHEYEAIHLPRSEKFGKESVILIGVKPGLMNFVKDDLPTSTYSQI